MPLQVSILGPWDLRDVTGFWKSIHLILPSASPGSLRVGLHPAGKLLLGHGELVGNDIAQVLEVFQTLL